MQDNHLQHLQVMNSRVENLERSLEGERHCSSNVNPHSQPVVEQKMVQLEQMVRTLEDDIRNLRVLALRSQQAAAAGPVVPPAAAADTLSSIKDQLTIHEAIITVLSREIEKLSLQV